VICGRSLMQFLALRAVSSQMPLAVQLPFLLWAAVRFGPAGTGLTLLATSLINAWAVVHGRGPFTSMPPATTITALTLSLIVVATTLLYLATLIEERRQTQHELRRRLRFEGLLSRLFAALVTQPSDRMHRAFQTWLGPISTVLEIDALALFTMEEGGDDLHPVYSWADPAADTAPQANVAKDYLPLARRSLLAEEPVIMTDP